MAKSKKKQIEELLDQGMGDAEIAKKLGTSAKYAAKVRCEHLVGSGYDNRREIKRMSKTDNRPKSSGDWIKVFGSDTQYEPDEGGEPVGHPPATQGKIAAMRKRLETGQALFQEGDYERDAR